MIKYEENLTSRGASGNLQPLMGASVTVTRLDNGLLASLYSDNGVTPLAQPLTTDDNGYFGFYAADGKYVLTFSGSRFATFTRQIVLEDPIDNPYATKADLAAGTGAALVTFTQAGAGAASRTAQDKLRDVVSVKDFGAKGDGVTDDSAAFNSALVAGNGAIRVPAGTYIAKNLTIPAGVTVIAVQGDRAVNNYYKRSNSTVIQTKGGDFIKGGATSTLFCARDVFIESSGQTGMCFGTTSATETDFCFENVGISGFQYGFYAPIYASSSFARDTSFSDCDYGLWSIDVANNTKLYNMGYNRCANGVRICGFGVEHAGAQFSLGYTGANAASFTEYICMDLFTGLVNVRDVYTEAYGQDATKNIIYNCRSSTYGDDHYKLDTFLSNTAGLRHFRIYSEDPTKAIKSNLIELNGSVPNNCPTIETKTGQTGLVRGVKVNGKTFSSKTGRAVFDTYDVTASITAGNAKVSAPTPAAFGTSAISLVGFDTNSILGYADILNSANTTTAAGRIHFGSPDYHHCPLGPSGATSGIFEVSGNIAMDGLAAAADYMMGIVYRVPGGSYAIKEVGLFKALAVPGATTFNFSAAFKVEVTHNPATSIGLCFIPSSSVAAPASADITGKLYGSIRVRYLRDQ